MTSSLREITRFQGRNIFQPPSPVIYHACLSSYAKLAKTNDAISRKWPKTSFFDTKLLIKKIGIFFSKNRLTFLPLSLSNFMQRMKILRAVFEKNNSLIIINYGDDLIGPLPYGGPKWAFGMADTRFRPARYHMEITISPS